MKNGKLDFKVVPHAGLPQGLLIATLGPQADASEALPGLYLFGAGFRWDPARKFWFSLPPSGLSATA